MICSICDNSYSCPLEFKKHFIFDHQFTCTDPINARLYGFFRCKEDNCNSSFNSFDSFIRHISSLHHRVFIEEQEVSSVSDENAEPDTINHQNEDERMHNSCEVTYSNELSNDEMCFENAKLEINKIILELRCKTSLPESTVCFFIDIMLKIAMILSSFIHLQFSLMLTALNLDKNKPEVRTFLNSLDFALLFKHTDTFAKQLKHNLSHLEYIAPQERPWTPWGQRVDTVNKRNESTTKVKTETFQYFPFTQTLKSIVKFTNVRQIIKKESESSSPGVYKSYLDGTDYLKNAFLQEHKNVLRINLYFDDIDVVNPIGSQSAVYKIACFYFTIQNAGYLNSQLDNIFILALCYTTDLKKYGFGPILAPFIEEMNLLQSQQGILVQTNDMPFELRATLIAFIGDSLAAHDIFGFSAPSSSCFCRQCMITKKDFHTDPLVVAAPRTEQNHKDQLQHLENSNYKKSVIKLYGLKQDSPLNAIDNFHCTDNCAFDPMHDLLEGVVPFCIKLVVKHFVQTRKLFSVSDLNTRIDKFRYGVTEATNKPSANFTNDMLNSSSTKLKQKSAQCWLLLRVFPFLIHHFLEDEDFVYLELIAKLIQICSIVFSPEITFNSICELEQTIEFYLQQFNDLFGDKEEDGIIIEGRNNIPKGHYLSHYAHNAVRKGPPAGNSCMRFEGKHYPIKQQIAAAHNFVNVPKSIAKRQSLLQAFNIKYKCFRTRKPFLTSIKFVEVNTLPCEQILLDFFGEIEYIKIASGCEIKNTKFLPNYVIRVEDDTESPYPNHGIIKHIVDHNGKIFFHCKRLQTCDFNEEFHAFEVEETGDDLFLGEADIIDFFPRNIWRTMNNETKYISAKYVF
jgi:hypothetical protein